MLIDNKEWYCNAAYGGFLVEQFNDNYHLNSRTDQKSYLSIWWVLRYNNGNTCMLES